jgi:glycosyltransferase involved in cell wall biosynthesis
VAVVASRPPWVLIEPFYGGSHRALVDGLVARLDRPVLLWTLPARHWKWRMRGAALHFAERWRRERPQAAGIFATSLLDAAALRGLLPAEAAALPFLLYFHEQQLAYPARRREARDEHFAWTNVQSAAAADRLLWNSAYNRDSFLAALPPLLARLPAPRLAALPAAIAARSQVLPVPVDLAALASAPRPVRGPVPRLVWNHRWEHDKGPEEFFAALSALAAEGWAFEVSVLGQQFRAAPAVFAAARTALGDRVRHWGFLPEREDYRQALLAGDLAISTARHEFQGLAVLEAAAAGCLPLVPDGLVYPEIWPASRRYPAGQLLPALRAQLAARETWAVPAAACRQLALAWDWSALLPRWQALFTAP